MLSFPWAFPLLFAGQNSIHHKTVPPLTIALESFRVQLCREPIQPAVSEPPKSLRARPFAQERNEVRLGDWFIANRLPAFEGLRDEGDLFFDLR